MPRAILLIDMDAFFASVEQARRPELRGRPVIVGGRAESRGVVSTASYEARACGVRTAMPMAQALRRCPEGVFLPVDMAAYKAVQEQLLAIYGRFTDLVEPVSIDEAFLDVTGSRRLFGSPQEIAGQVQRLTEEELGLSCSIFTDRHAYLATARFSANLDDLLWLRWHDIGASDFARDPEDPGKFEQYQAEAMAHRHVPTPALLGIACSDTGGAATIKQEVARRGLALPVAHRPGWFV